MSFRSPYWVLSYLQYISIMCCNILQTYFFMQTKSLCIVLPHRASKDNTCFHIPGVWSYLVGWSLWQFSFIWLVKDLLSCQTVNATDTHRRDWWNCLLIPPLLRSYRQQGELLAQYFHLEKAVWRFEHQYIFPYKAILHELPSPMCALIWLIKLLQPSDMWTNDVLLLSLVKVLFKCFVDKEISQDFPDMRLGI